MQKPFRNTEHSEFQFQIKVVEQHAAHSTRTPASKGGDSMSGYLDRIEIAQGHYLRVSRAITAQGKFEEVEAAGEPAKTLAHRVAVCSNPEKTLPPTTRPIEVNQSIEDSPPSARRRSMIVLSIALVVLIIVAVMLFRVFV